MRIFILVLLSFNLYADTFQVEIENMQREMIKNEFTRFKNNVVFTKNEKNQEKYLPKKVKPEWTRTPLNGKDKSILARNILFATD